MLVDLFTMAETIVRMSVVLYNLNTFLLLHLVICGRSLRSSPSTRNGLNNFADSSLFQHGNILSPLLRALSEQDGEHWRHVDPNPKQRAEPRHVRYMKRLYKKSVSQKGAAGTNPLFNTVRLITPRDECLERSKEIFMQDLSFNLEQQQQAEQCPLGPEAQHASSFLLGRGRRPASRSRWVEVDVSSFLLPLVQAHQKDIHLLINLTCAEERGVKMSRGGSVEMTLRSPSLLLYLNDTSERASHHRAPVPDQRSAGWNRFETQRDSEAERWVGQNTGRLRRSATRNRAAKASLPELKSTYDFPTNDCALYDFRVTFSQLKLNHWIIYPHWYNPRYCKGTCPRTMGFMYGSPVHTMVQSIIYERLDASVPRPSCVPSEYKPMNVITEYNGIITYKVYEEMIATRCTCR
ncbi:growth/differentiation factor 9 isoform X2 [Osmerus eperlanus]|uniref:growth/differentiation factor 9 isoform X2 n=1 Tax=Osmerus eperlanus TaxID=29151 RepID=UPI002E0F4E36